MYVTVLGRTIVFIVSWFEDTYRGRFEQPFPSEILLQGATVKPKSNVMDNDGDWTDDIRLVS